MHDEDYKNSFPVGVIPKNYSVWRDAIGSIILNFLEGAGITFVIALGFFSIPFVFELKVALTFITFIIVTAFEFKGCHDYTLIIAYAHYVKWKKSAKKYELGTADTATVKKHKEIKVPTGVFEKLKNTDWKAIVADYESKAKEKLENINSDKS